jgi:hypothetical protein
VFVTFRALCAWAYQSLIPFPLWRELDAETPLTGKPCGRLLNPRSWRYIDPHALKSPVRGPSGTLMTERGVAIAV